MNKYLRRLFLANFITFLVFSLVFLTLVLYQNTKNQSVKVHVANDTLLMQTVQNIDEQLNLSLTLVNQVAESAVWRSENFYASGNNYNEVMIKDDLKRTTNLFSDAMFTLAVVNILSQRVIDSDYSMSAEQYFDELGLSGITTSLLAERVDNGNKFSPYVVFSINNEIFIARPAAQPANKNFIVLCHVRADYLSNLPISQQSGVVMMIVRDRERLYSNIKDNFTQKLVDWHAGIAGVSYERNKDTLDDYDVYSEPFKSMFASCVVAIPSSSGVTRETVVWYGLMIIVFSLLTVPTAMLTSKMIYRPINDLLNNIGKIGGTLDDKDELLYVEKTINKINNINKELRELVSIREKSLKNRFLKDYLLGYEVLDSEQMQKHNIPEGAIQMALFEVIGFESEEFGGESTNEINTSAFYLLFQIISNTNKCDIVNMPYNRYCLMVYGECEGLKDSLSQFILDVNEEFGLKIVAALSNTEISDVSESYLNISEILDNRYAFGDRFIIVPNDYSENLFDGYYYPFELEREIINNILSGKRQQAEVNIQRLLEENLDKRSLGKESKDSFVMAVAGTINRILERAQLHVDDVYGEGAYVFTDLKLSVSSNDLRGKTIEMFSTVMDSIENKEKNLSRYIAQKISHYIEKNYNKDISLRDVAENLGYSIAYTSNMFKQHLRENFKDYLNKYRVEKAKELMQANSSILVKEIIDQVGMNSQDTFIRMFKRYEGMTPGKYIKSIPKE